MTLQEIIRLTKEVELGETIIVGIENNRADRTIARLYNLYRNNKNEMYAVLKKGEKIRIDEMILDKIRDKNEKQLNKYHKSPKTFSLDIMLNTYQNIQQVFPKLTNNEIKKLLVNHTVTEIMEGHYDSKGKFQPKDIFQFYAKQYLYDN